MTYLCINFPQDYRDDTRIYLKDFLTEAEGIKFSFILMRQVIDTQVENELLRTTFVAVAQLILKNE